METARKAYDFLGGEKLYQQRAREVLPILVRQAKAAQKIYYSNLAEEVGIPNPRNLNYPLGSIGNALKSLSKKLKIEIPQIQCIVVNKGTELPGEGIGWFIDKTDFKKLTTKQKNEIVNRVLSEIFAFDKWDEVLAALDLKPTLHNSIIKDAVKKAGLKYGHGGESEHHKKLKNQIMANPSLIGIDSGYDSKPEYLLPSADTVDILFRSDKEWVGVEVKSHISSQEDILRGLFQCVKYQALLEAYLAVSDDNKNVKVFLAIGGPFPPELIPVKNVLGINVVDNIKV